VPDRLLARLPVAHVPFARSSGEERVMEYVGMFMRGLVGWVWLAIPFLILTCLGLSGSVVWDLLISKRCRNPTVLFLIAPFKWARGDDRFDHDDFDIFRMGDPLYVLPFVFALTARMLLTLAFIWLIFPVAYVLKLLYSLRRS
jgi:hypothetical protein